MHSQSSYHVKIMQMSVDHSYKFFKYLAYTSVLLILLGTVLCCRSVTVSVVDTNPSTLLKLYILYVCIGDSVSKLL